MKLVPGRECFKHMKSFVARKILDFNPPVKTHLCVCVCHQICSCCGLLVLHCDSLSVISSQLTLSTMLSALLKALNTSAKKVLFS